MADLKGAGTNDIGINYKGIINLGTVGTPTAGINLPLTVVATGYKVVTDGMGNPSPLQLAQDAVKVDSILTVSGNVFSANTFTGRLNANSAGAASNPPASFTGTWFSGGTATTTKPQLLIEPTGATSTNWDTNGTGLGINAVSGFVGNLIDLQVNGVSRFKVVGGGTSIVTSYSFANKFGHTAGNTTITFPQEGSLAIVNGAEAPAFADIRLQFGGSTNLHPALKRNAASLEVKLANDSAYTGLNAGILSVLNAGTSGVPAVSVTGSWFAGNTPQFLIQSSATSNPSWSASGTGLGINAPGGLASNANIIATFANGTAAFRTQFDGDILFGGGGARIRPTVATATSQATSISGQALSVYGANLVGPGHQFIVFTNAFTTPSGNDNGAMKLVTSFTPNANGSSNFNPLNIVYTINAGITTQTGTIAGIFSRATETQLGGATHNLIDLGVGSTSIFSVSNVGVPNFNQTTSGSAGGNSGQHLVIRVGNTNYKIALLTP